MSLTSSALAAPPADRGDQFPRICSVPPCLTTAGAEAVELAASVGLVLDPWQAFVLDQSLGERADGKWAAFEAGVIVSRQNGKGAILEARELAGLFLFGEELILHSAHEFKTAADAFRRIAALIQDNRHFSRHIARIRTANGSEMIELKSGQRLRFVARSAGSGRGFSADMVILDEAYNLGDKEMEALLPTLSARPNPQVWYASTAGHPTSVQLGRIRERGLTGTDQSLAFFEWSAEDGDDHDAVATWRKANPGLGIRITEEYVRRERASLSAEGFARERLGIGQYPADLADAWQVIPREDWDALADVSSVAGDPVAFGAEVTLVAPHKRMATISAAGRRADGRVHVEVVDHRQDVAWVVPRLAELRRAHRPCAVVVDPSSHAGALIEGLEKAGVEVAAPFTARDAAQAFGQFRDAVAAGGLRHLGQESLDRSLAGATTRPLSDALAWDRKNLVVDLGPVVSASLALWGWSRYGRGRLAPYDLLRSVS
jgi:phage terminase large subunit-like protein